MTKFLFGALAFLVTISQARADWVGQASYYHHPRYAGLICAHRSLPFGTHLLVTNLANGRHTTVMVVDRGPFIRNRIIDVSTSAADALGFRQAGLARVRFVVVDK